MSVREPGPLSRANGAKFVIDHSLRSWRLMKQIEGVMVQGGDSRGTSVFASVWLTDYSQVDMLGVQCVSFMLGARKRPGSPKNIEPKYIKAYVLSQEVEIYYGRRLRYTEYTEAGG